MISSIKYVLNKLNILFCCGKISAAVQTLDHHGKVIAGQPGQKFFHIIIALIERRMKLRSFSVADVELGNVRPVILESGQNLLLTVAVGHIQGIDKLVKQVAAYPFHCVHGGDKFFGNFLHDL